MQRVAAYIDGFNLFYGMKEAKLRHCYWLDVQKLVNRLVLPQEELKNQRQIALIKYFTARITGPKDKRLRQATYLEALATLDQIQIIEGQYCEEDVQCRKCYYPFTVPKEKMTDVNIAVNLLIDAFEDKYDTAMVISGDSDLVPPVKAVLRMFPTKRVIAVFPPHRYSNEQSQAASHSYSIFPDYLAKCALPNEVKRADGFLLKNPWL